MPAPISAATDGRAPGPLSLAGDSASRARIVDSATGAPPWSWANT